MHPIRWLTSFSAVDCEHARPRHVGAEEFRGPGSQKVGVGTEPGGRQASNHVHLYRPPLSGTLGSRDDRLSPVNHVHLYRPPLSARHSPRMWRLAQNLGVGRRPTTCTCTDLPFLAP